MTDVSGKHNLVSDAALYANHPYVAILARAMETMKSPSNQTSQQYGLLDTIEHQSAQFSFGLNGVNLNVNYITACLLGVSLSALLIATFLQRWIHIGEKHFRYLITMGDIGLQKHWTKNSTRWWPWIKRHLLYAPIWKVRRNEEMQLSSAVTMGTLPGRFHALLLLVYLGSNIAYCLLLDWSRPTPEILAALRGRSGELAMVNLMPTILFALRNNPLIYILRVPFDTFNLFHRWCARVMLIETLIHAFAFGANAITAGGSRALSDALSVSTSYKWGTIATVTLFIMTLLASSPIRHAFYETFIHLHRLFIVLVMIGIYIHIEKSKLPQLPLIRAVFVFYAAEWAARLYRIFYNNVSVRNGCTKVTIEALPSEACRLTFHIARDWHFRPGSHVHIYIPSISQFGSHPFSVAWGESRPSIQHSSELDIEKLPLYNSAGDPQQRLPPSVLSAKAGFQMSVTNLDQDPSLKSPATPSFSTHATVSLIVRARTGMTRTLYERAAATKSGELVLPAAIEGPYGGHESLLSYGTVVMFAGGVGITHCISHLKPLLEAYGERCCSTRKILLVWSVPNTEALEWVRPWMDKILRMEGRRDVLRIQLFVTRPRHQAEIRSNTGTVQMFPGRCNPATILEKEMHDRIGAVGVIACGPGGFSDNVRRAARSQTEVGKLDFIEEAFTY